jgi:hypothetical protein
MPSGSGKFMPGFRRWKGLIRHTIRVIACSDDRADSAIAPERICSEEVRPVSIVRIGLSETKHFAEGYDMIFGKKKAAAAKKPRPRAKAKSSKAKRTKKKT